MIKVSSLPTRKRKQHDYTRFAIENTVEDMSEPAQKRHFMKQINAFGVNSVSGEGSLNRVSSDNEFRAS